MKIRILAILCMFVFVPFLHAQESEINIIPKPRSIRQKIGSFELTSKTKIFVRTAQEKRLAAFLNDFLKKSYGFELKVSSKEPDRSNAILLGEGSGDFRFPENGYYLMVDDRIIGISAPNPTGKFYGLQSLIQMMPPERGERIRIPNTEIIDEPRFPYRGMHLDVARHFMPVEFVKKYIDLMAQYKFNYFHWHLTEDQGWRIEIKKYPRLTEIGSKRPESHSGPYSPMFKGDGIPIEGYYTQKEIKDVVAYAKERHITVIPEIELPGHASAALAAYPQFGCKENYNYKVQMTWGIFKEVYCPTDATFKFLEDVLDETIKLFPDSPYIHIGGDEVLKDHWKESAFVQELKAKENLKDEHEVQSYFIRRVEKFINSKGKKLIGWDEILEGGLAPNATVMSWRGTKGGIEAAKAKHDVIMSPNEFAYFDHGQGDPAHEPLNIGGYTPLEEVYRADIMPKELNGDEKKYILGGQANMWTEYLKKPESVEYMLMPRMLALSEILWSRPEDKNYDDFLRRLNAHLPKLDKQNVNYRIPEPGGLRNIVTTDEKIMIELQPAPGTRVYYTLDGRYPDENSTPYEGPIEVDLKERKTVPIFTRVVNAAGRKSSVYGMAVVGYPMREPENVAFFAEPKQGVMFKLVSEAGERSGETKSLNPNQFAKEFDLKKNFTVSFDGYLKVPADGVYEFQADSVWEATIVLGGSPIIFDAGADERRVRSVIVPLKAGLHKIGLRYNHRGGEPFFRVRYGIKGQGLNQLNGGEFVH